jgi:hypothetical protein
MTQMQVFIFLWCDDLQPVRRVIIMAGGNLQLGDVADFFDNDTAVMNLNVSAR